MDDLTYKEFLALMMCSDPWPLDGAQSRTILEQFADKEALKRGYENWIVAYHEM